VDSLFISVLNISLTASYVIVAIMLVRLFLKKAPKTISYAIWAVAGLRLAIPFTFESIFSLIPFRSQPISQTATLGENVSFSSSAGAVLESVGDVANGGLETIAVQFGKIADGYPMAAEAYNSNVWLMFGSYLWIIGIVVLLIYSVVSIILLNRRLHAATLIEDNIYEAENLKTPFVLGLFRPKIYIPSGLPAEEKSYIILHEQTHIRRFDPLVKMVAFIILCVHWFNPLVWVAFLLMSADMEMSCDERVLKEMGSKIKQVYATSLLSLATGRRLINGSPIAFGEGNVKVRIKNILNFKKPTAWVMIVSIIFVIVLIIGFTSNRPSADVLLDGEVYDFTSKSPYANALLDGKVYDCSSNLYDGVISSPTSTKIPSEGMELIAKADLDRNGGEESIYLDKTQIESTHDITLHVLDSSGYEIWSELANTSHAGWNSLFLFEQDGEDYLLQYNPTMYQGYCTYAYTLFTLESGNKKVYRTNTLEFDINGTKELDIPKMISFADEVNALLGKSVLLMSTKDGVYSFGPSVEGFYERYSWLDEMPKLYEVGDDLEMRLKKYSDYAVSNRKISEGKVRIDVYR